MISIPPPPAGIRRPLRLGVVGLGWAANNCHLPSLELLRSAGWPIEVAWLCDRDPDRLKSAGSNWPQAQLSLDPRAVIIAQKLDGILILTHPGSSAALVREALAYHPTIFVEKPVAEKPSDLIALHALARQAKAIVQVGYNRRHQALYPAFRTELERMTLPLHLRIQFWRTQRHEPIFYQDTLVHPIELLLGTLGPLAITDIKNWRGPPNSIDANWQVGLVSERQPTITAEIDIRPNTGMETETYDALGQGESCILRYPYQGITGNQAAVVKYYRGGEETLGYATLANPDQAASCYYRGFLNQMIEFVSLCSGLSSQPTCGLEAATATLDLFAEVARRVAEANLGRLPS